MPDHLRLVLGIHHGATSGELMQHAVEMAHLLGIEIFGVFVEDEAVLGTASFPFAREFRLHSHEWHPMDPTNVETEFRHAASAAKRLLETITRARGVRYAFEVHRGNPSGVVAGLLCASDIVVLAEPKAGANELTQSFLRAWRMACGSDASVLLLPPGRMRRHGPVVALLNGDRGARTAAHIANLAGETLLLLGPAEALAAVTVDLPADRVRARVVSTLTENALRSVLGDGRERLLVLDRDGLSAEPEAMVLRVAAARRTPVLLVGPSAQ